MLIKKFLYLVDDIHDIDAQLGQEEDTAVVADELPTRGTLIFLEPGIAHSNTRLGVDAPVTGQDP